MEKKNIINMKSLMEDIDKASKMFKTSLVLEGFGEDPRMQEQPQEQGMGEEMPPQEGGVPQNNEMGMEGEPQTDEQSVDIINKIRELAIQGIAKYANEVESDRYTTMKRIWLECDKFYEAINKKEE